MSSKNLDHIYYGLVDEEPPAKTLPVKVQVEEVNGISSAATSARKTRKKKGPKGPTDEEIRHASAFNDMMSGFGKSV